MDACFLSNQSDVALQGSVTVNESVVGHRESIKLQERPFWVLVQLFVIVHVYDLFMQW